MRSFHELDVTERRVVGALLEKEQATPEYYPLTLKALVAACNQKTNRDPVLALAEIDVLNTLRVLQQEGLVERVTGARVDRWAQRVDSVTGYDPARKAVLTLLLLRGAQTPGELRARSERLHAFEDVGAVEETLLELSGQEPPLVRALARRPGQKETRWALFSDSEDVESAAPPPPLARPSGPSDDLIERLRHLEQEIAELREQVEEIRRALG